MLLAIDARNSVVSIGVRCWEGAERRNSVDSANADNRTAIRNSFWETHFRVAAVERSADEWTWLLRSFLVAAGIESSSLDGAVIASVVPRLTSRLQESVRRLLPAGGDALLVGPGVKTGLSVRTDNPAEIGADLIANAVAASAVLTPPCLVVDFGVALTFTAVDGRGALVGAAIAPGLESAASMLRDHAALLPQIRLQAPVKAIGRNSAESVRSGLMLGWTGLIDRLIETMGAELGAPELSVAIVGTGEADEPPLTPTRGWDLWDPLLTMEGLFLIAAKNR